MRGLAALATAFFLVSTAAFAGTTCGTATVVPADGRVVDFDFVAGGTTNYYQFSVTSGRSYSVEAREDYDDPPSPLTEAIHGEATSCTVALAGTTQTETFEPALPQNAFRASFIASSSGVYSLSVQNPPGTGRYVSVSVSETTLYNNNWTTFAGFITQFGFQNTTSHPINGVLTVVDAQGTPTISLPPQSFPIAANSGIAPVLGPGYSLNMPANHGGVSFFAHNGPPGAVLANAYFTSFNPLLIIPIKFEPIRERPR